MTSANKDVNGKETLSSPRYAQDLASMDPATFQGPEFALIDVVWRDLDKLRGKEVIKLYQIHAFVGLIWREIFSATGLPVGASYAACIRYSLDKLRETQEFKRYAQVVADKAFSVHGLAFKLRMSKVVGSLKHPVLYINLGGVGEEKYEITENVCIKCSEEVKSSLYTTADMLGMSASGLATICVAKGLSDADEGIESDFRVWAESGWRTLLEKIDRHRKDVEEEYEVWREHYKGKRKKGNMSVQ